MLEVHGQLLVFFQLSHQDPAIRDLVCGINLAAKQFLLFIVLEHVLVYECVLD